MVKKKRKIQMPSSIRKKMMAATSMLLVSAILMVTTSYAWFTLSTAPEVTGITTSVGANGNLEMALLTTESFANTELITSNTGDSMDAAGKNATTANITWGNLVDLSHSSYGLGGISLYPSAVNIVEGVLQQSPLSIPEYGVDGRVKELGGATISAVLDQDTQTFKSTDAQTYGVRAVGTTSSVSPRMLTFKSARSTYSSRVANVASPTSTAVKNNSSAFMAIAVQGQLPEKYTAEQVSGMLAMTKGVESSLRNIVSAYANAILAKAAATTSINDETVATISSLLTGVTSAETLLSAIDTVSESIDNSYKTDLETLESAQKAVANAINAAETLLGTGTAEFADETIVGEKTITISKDIATPLLGEITSAVVGYSKDGETTYTGKDILNAKVVCLTGGAVSTVASYCGPFKVMHVDLTDMDIYIGNYNTTASKLSEVTTSVEALKLTSDSNATALIEDQYGYILDFAFRTNAASSNLLLQTTAKNRVYSNENDGVSGDALQGAGSTATFTYSAISGTQATKLLEAVRVVFFNPDNSSVYGTAKLSDIEAGARSATANLLLVSSETTTYTLGKDAFTETATEGADATTYAYTLKDNVTVNGTTVTLDSSKYTVPANKEAYDALNAKTTATVTSTLAAKDEGVITALQQNIVQKVSVLVYLDGNNIDNSAVANAADSGTLQLNLQFSSSAALDPMDNSALKALSTEGDDLGGDEGNNTNGSTPGDNTQTN